MNAEALVSRALDAFADIARPERFTDVGHCCECRDHDAELQPFTPETVTRAALGGPSWDPITFTTEAGFRYWLPGMIRVVVTETGDDSYLEQFLWHVHGAGDFRDARALCSTQQRSVVHETLLWLLEHRSDDVEREMAADDLLAAIARWSAT